jgi:hypothetical protein
MILIPQTTPSQYCTADKEYRTLMNEAKRIRENANAARTSQDDEEEEDNSDISILFL